MNNGKAPTSKYQDYLVASLRDPAAAAAYLTAILDEPEPEPELFWDALQDVMAALGTPDLQAQAHQLSANHANVMSELKTYCEAMGLQLVVAPKALNIDNPTRSNLGESHSVMTIAAAS
jgi:DNA-binding phage protein